MRRLLRRALLGIALAAPLALALHADASVAYESPYTFDQTFGTAVRLVRVDLGLKILEKDADSGFVLFEYKSPESGGRVSNGSLEIVKGKDHVHVSAQLPAMPRYHEQVLIDALAKKLVAEHGDPPARPKPAPPAVDDAGDGQAP